jgi:hypothetical protein
MSTENQIAALKGKCTEAELFARAVSDTMTALMQPLHGLPLREATAQLELLQAKLEGVRHERQRQTLRVPGWGRTRRT